MSSTTLRRLAIVCRSTPSLYHGRRSFLTSSPHLVETSGTPDSSTPNADSPRTVTLIPGESNFAERQVRLERDDEFQF